VNYKKYFQFSMGVSIIIYICRVISIILMYSGLFIGSICTVFILREFYYHSQLRTSLSILIVTILISDCIRANICAPLESYVLIKTWNTAIINCEEKRNLIESYLLILNFCRLTSSVRFCFTVAQAFGFVAIAYERLRTIIQRNGNLNLNHMHHHPQGGLARLKYAIIWISLSLSLGISMGLYRGITYSFSNTCYDRPNTSSFVATIIRLFCILNAALISGIIYGKIFFFVKKSHQNIVTPIVGTTNNQIARQVIDMRRKDFRLAKNTFLLFLSFFLCRIPWVIISILSLIISEQSNTTQCYLAEFADFSFQLTYLATITDPIAYIYSQPILKQKFLRSINFCWKNRIPEPIEH
jgi:hypothetical protein